MKLAETIVIDANESQLRTAMRPHQLGCGVPDGAVLHRIGDETGPRDAA